MAFLLMGLNAAEEQVFAQLSTSWPNTNGRSIQTQKRQLGIRRRYSMLVTTSTNIEQVARD